MHESLLFETYPQIGMQVSAIDGYVGTIVAVQASPQSTFTIFMEPAKAFIDLSLFFVDRISADHIMLNINRQSLQYLEKR